MHFRQLCNFLQDQFRRRKINSTTAIALQDLSASLRPRARLPIFTLYRPSSVPIFPPRPAHRDCACKSGCRPTALQYRYHPHPAAEENFHTTRCRALRAHPAWFSAERTGRRASADRFSSLIFIDPYSAFVRNSRHVRQVGPFRYALVQHSLERDIPDKFSVPSAMRPV